MAILCYRIDELPDLNLNKYSSLEGRGVDGVLDKHLSFLRQWNRKGALSNLSFHLLFYYDGCDTNGHESNSLHGNKLEIMFVVSGEERELKNVPQLIKSSTLSDYYSFLDYGGKQGTYPFEQLFQDRNIDESPFSVCSVLSKKEVFIESESDGNEDTYYNIPEWEINESGRLYHMCKILEALDKRMLYRVDLYPVERNVKLREDLKKPIRILRERQNRRFGNLKQNDYESDGILKRYEDTLERYDEAPHFQANIMVFGNDVRDVNVVLDAAGAEALEKGNYQISSFHGSFNIDSFLNTDENRYEDENNEKLMYQSLKGMIVCDNKAIKYRLRYLPTLFTLEEISPFFRFPALYEGENIQKRKETDPQSISSDQSIYLGKDDRGYNVYFPLKNLSKHAFIAGVPGSGKTNTMLHFTSSLWKNHKIPFLILEPAKKEYRALLNLEGMEDVHFFSPNAKMDFPLHINPFMFPKGLMLSEHIRALVDVFQGAFPLENPMPFLLDTAIESVYKKLGWQPDTLYTEDTKLKFPTMSMLYKQLEKELESTNYSPEIRGNLESALKVRIGSLLRREMGDIFDVPQSSIAPEKWLQIPAIIELEAMGTGPANFMTLMLCTLIRESLKVKPNYHKNHARHMIFIEEAHNLIGPDAEEVVGSEANPKQAATAYVVKMLAEVRALQEGIVIADQLPTKMADEVIKNTGLKIAHRITSMDDSALMGSTMAANPMQVEEMAIFDVGRSLISYEGLKRPFRIQVQEWCGLGSDDYINDTNERKAVTVSKNDSELYIGIKDNDSYKNTVLMSFKIACGKLMALYDNNVSDYETVYNHLLQISVYMQQINNDQNTLNYNEVTHKLEVKDGIQESLENIQDRIFSLQYDLDNLKSSELYMKRVELINNCMLVAIAIHKEMRIWQKKGLLTMVVEDSKTTRVQIFNNMLLNMHDSIKRAEKLLNTGTYTEEEYQYLNNRIHLLKRKVDGLKEVS